MKLTDMKMKCVEVLGLTVDWNLDCSPKKSLVMETSAWLPQAFFFFSWVYFDPGTQFSKCLSQRHMLNQPQNWSVSLSPSDTSYTLSLGEGAGPSRNKHTAGIHVLSGGFSSLS